MRRGQASIIIRAVLLAMVGAGLATAQSRQPATQPLAQSNQQTTGLKVLVVDPIGAVISHASIQLANEKNELLQKGFTDEAGQLTLAVSSPGWYLLEVSARGLQAHKRVNVSAGAITNVAVHAQFPLEPGTGGITGSVTDPSGEGIPDVHIYVRSGGERFDALTDCGGHYRISGLEPGNYSLQFGALEFRLESKAPVLVCPDRATQVDAQLKVTGNADSDLARASATVEVGHSSSRKLSSSTWIRGTVTDLGSPVPGAHVQARQPGGKIYDATTDSGGHYQLSDLPGGSYCMSVDAAGFAIDTMLNIPAGQPRDFQLEEATPTEFNLVCESACAPPQIVTDSSTSPSDLQPTPTPADRTGIRLQIQPDRDFASTTSELWLMVQLTNAGHDPIFVPSHATGYEIYAREFCGCGGHLKKPFLSKNSVVSNQSGPVSEGGTIRLLPGATLTDRIELSRFLDLPWHTIYSIWVEYPYESDAAYGHWADFQPFVHSNVIKVRWIPPALAASCK